ncbi:MAG: hypothetical protein DIU70_000820 [Bacillota bacterium]
MCRRGHRRGRQYVSLRTAMDDRVRERTGLDEVSLRRLRRALMARFRAVPYPVRRRLLEDGPCSRLHFLNTVLKASLPEAQWRAWLRSIEHSEQDLTEMARGEYPISPHLIRLYSALFGIKVDFLLLGHPPTVEPRGVPIDLWPATGTTR